MSLISIPFTFSAGAVIIASQHNSNFTTISSDYNGNIDNTNIALSAGIVYSKLSLTGSIVNADINASAAIIGSKLNLSSPGAIGGTTPSTGAFSTLKVGTTNQGDILYDNGTTLVRLTPGTSGYFLQTQGNSANPQWAAATPGLILLSTTSVSGSADTGNITLTSGHNYKVIVKGQLSGITTLGLLFNADNGGRYYYIRGGYSGGANVVNTRTTAASAVIFNSANMLNTNNFSISMDIINNSDSINYKSIIGNIEYTDASGYSINNITAIYQGVATITSFVLVPTTGTITATVWTYEYSGT